jgi:hypothetical protein
VRVTDTKRIPKGAMVRTLLLAAIAMAACVYAIVRVVTHGSRVRSSPPASSAPAESGSAELPAPEIVPTE